MKRSGPPNRRRTLRRKTPLRANPPPRRRPRDPNTYNEARQARAIHAGHRCEADGLHHPDCPGIAHRDIASEFVTHHVIPRARGGPDTLDNLRLVWNGYTNLGAGGCHGRIHSNPNQAELLGLLDTRPDTGTPNP